MTQHSEGLNRKLVRLLVGAVQAGDNSLLRGLMPNWVAEALSNNRRAVVVQHRGGIWPGISVCVGEQQLCAFCACAIGQIPPTVNCTNETLNTIWMRSFIRLNFSNYFTKFVASGQSLQIHPVS